MDKKTLEKLGPLANQNFVYVLILALFVLYLASGWWPFGLLVGLSVVWVVMLEFLLGAKEHGLKHEIKETAAALLLALVLWFGAGFVLQTPSPLNAIVSCSMLPSIQRGDMVVLSGDRLLAPQETVASIANIEDAAVYRDGELAVNAKGSMYSYCVQRQNVPLCNDFVSAPGRFTEKHGGLTFGYDKCEILFPKTGARQYGPCVTWLEVNGRKYYTNLSNDVVVYQPNKDEYYARVGDIIHRAFIKLASGNQTYFLTKGDNNPVFDVQVYDEKTGAGNRPVEIQRSKGRILLSVPYLGYFKLFISPSAIPTPEGCDRYYAKYAS